MKLRQLISSDDAKPEKKQHVSPCSDCPFARKALPGWLGAHSVPWWLNCAHSEGPMECHTRTIAGKPAQCAGASIFRANVCKRVTTPNLELRPDKTRVFGRDTEFASHHLKRAVSQEEVGGLKMRELFAAVGAAL